MWEPTIALPIYHTDTINSFSKGPVELIRMYWSVFDTWVDPKHLSYDSFIDENMFCYHSHWFWAPSRQVAGKKQQRAPSSPETGNQTDQKTQPNSRTALLPFFLALSPATHPQPGPFQWNFVTPYIFVFLILVLSFYLKKANYCLCLLSETTLLHSSTTLNKLSQYESQFKCDACE